MGYIELSEDIICSRNLQMAVSGQHGLLNENVNTGFALISLHFVALANGHLLAVNTSGICLSL